LTQWIDDWRSKKPDHHNNVDQLNKVTILNSKCRKKKTRSTGEDKFSGQQKDKIQNMRGETSVIPPDKKDEKKESDHFLNKSRHGNVNRKKF